MHVHRFTGHFGLYATVWVRPHQETLIRFFVLKSVGARMKSEYRVISLDPCAPKARSVHFEFPSPFFAQQGSKMPKRCDQRTLGKGLHLTGFFELFSLISNTNLVGSDPHVTRNGAITFHSVCTEVIKLQSNGIGAGGRREPARVSCLVLVLGSLSRGIPARH